MFNKIKSAWARRQEVKASLQAVGLKQTVLNESGAVNMTMIAAEAVGILVLTVIWSIIPYIGSALETTMPAVNNTSAWYGAASGSTLWLQAEPMLRICIIVIIIALVLAVVMGLKNRNNNNN
jgi:hypothetical protein